MPWITLALPPLSLSILLALALSVAMTVVGVTLLFTHERTQEQFDQWVDFSFSRDTLRKALTYYRVIGISMGVFYVLFVISCLLLQWDGHQLFANGQNPTWAGPFTVMMFAFDLVLRGGLFDFMQHFDLSISHVGMNRKAWGFVWYAFIFRMFYGLTLLRILISFVWIYGKIHRARDAASRLPR
jgi:hypothetical protein